VRIAQVAPLYESVPPKLYGGTERVVSYLTEELVRLGHEVTLFASGDSVTKARLIPACSEALWRKKNSRETLPHHVHLMDLVFQDASRFDVIHFHCDYIQFALLDHYPCRSVTTLHGLLHTPDLKPLLSAHPDTPLVSVSDNQRSPMPEANWQATVYHGLPRDLHTYSAKSGQYLAFLGRMSPEKGVDRAIEIAQRAQVELRIAAKIYPEERVYFEEKIVPLLRRARRWVEFIGEIGGAEKDEFLGSARALLFPIDWAEPFGLVMIEALACGTPVIGWRNGSVPELITDGCTGFVVGSLEEAIRAVDRIGGLSRQTCRAEFERRFDAARMAEDYAQVYRSLPHLAGSGGRNEGRNGASQAFAGRLQARQHQYAG
jgi:glycosyltransferase involved in cell wall biosynthesis